MASDTVAELGNIPGLSMRTIASYPKLRVTLHLDKPIGLLTRIDMSGNFITQ